MPEGHTRFGFVKDGNMLASRSTLLLWLASVLSLLWMLEQPSGSILPKHPRIDQFFGLVSVAWYVLVHIDFSLIVDFCVFFHGASSFG